jgi:hypothetical protein
MQTKIQATDENSPELIREAIHAMIDAFIAYPDRKVLQIAAVGNVFRAEMELGGKKDIAPGQADKDPVGDEDAPLSAVNPMGW